MRFSRRKASGCGIDAQVLVVDLPRDQVIALIVRRALGGDVRVARLQQRHAQVDRHLAVGFQRRLEVQLRQRAVLGDLDQGPVPQPRLQLADREPEVPQRVRVELDRAQAPVVVHRPFLVELHQLDELPMLGQEVVLAQEHPLVPVDFTSRHGLSHPSSISGTDRLQYGRFPHGTRPGRSRYRGPGHHACNDHNTKPRAFLQSLECAMSPEKGRSRPDPGLLGESEATGATELGRLGHPQSIIRFVQGEGLPSAGVRR